MTDNSPETGPWFHYRREGEVTLVELKLTRIEQLFNSLDPSPFHEKDLDRDAETYIVDSLRDLPPDAPVKIVIHLPTEELIEPGIRTTPDAIRHYFAYCRDVTERRLRLLLREGRFTLGLGLVFLFSCIALRQLFFRQPASPFEGIVAEGLLILGWVAMWRPTEMLLYDWWPVRRLVKTYARLADIDVELRARTSPTPGARQDQTSAAR